MQPPVSVTTAWKTITVDGVPLIGDAAPGVMVRVCAAPLQLAASTVGTAGDACQAAGTAIQTSAMVHTAPIRTRAAVVGFACTCRLVSPRPQRLSDRRY